MQRLCASYARTLPHMMRTAPDGTAGADRLGTLFRLTRIENLLTFAQVAVGYALGKGFHLTAADGVRLLEAVTVLGVLLYSGIYALNDVMDADLDAQNSLKRTRPIPAGRLRRSTALAISLGLIAGGLTAAAVLDAAVLLPMAATLLVVNLFYTGVAKHLPYLDILTNGVTHALRLFYGFQLAGVPANIPLVVIWYIGATHIALFRRVKELWQGDAHGRPVLARYTPQTLLTWYGATLAVTAALSFASGGLTRAIGLGWIVYTLFAILGIWKSRRIRRIAEFLWR